jgi:anti-sigma28 factor (negative regulator of flagellin synthesis)
MQISNQEVDRVKRETARQSESQEAEAPVKSVEELAARNGVGMDEVRRVTQKAMMAEEDPARERRLRELAKRVAEGRYTVEPEQMLDMAERRAIADRSKNL